MKHIKSFNEATSNGIEILSIKKPDGTIFNIGDKYIDGNGTVSSIGSMDVSGDKIFLNGVDGGFLDARNARKNNTNVLSPSTNVIRNKGWRGHGTK